MDQVIDALGNTLTGYVNAWRNACDSLPQSQDYLDLPSPCVWQQTDSLVLWQPVKRDKVASLHPIERAMEITLHADCAAFYGSYYAGDLLCRWQDVSLTLLQVWSDEDFVRLQENLIAHLFMQKKRKLSPSIFLATLASEHEVISLCNVSGEIVLEQIGQHTRRTLAPSLVDFLRELTPEVSA